VLLRAETPITPDDTAGTLTARLSTIGAELLVRTLDGILTAACTKSRRTAWPPTLTRKIRKHHGLIDWTKDATHVWRQIRAMTPWPARSRSTAGRRLQIDAALPAEGGRAMPNPGQSFPLNRSWSLRKRRSRDKELRPKAAAP
jgi:methionyl-tRNA formyltransferase